MKVSSRTYQEEIRRRNESKPVEVIDYSKLNRPSTDKSVDKPIDKSIDRSIDKSVDKPVNKPADKSIDKPVDKPVNPWKKKLPNYVCIQSLH